MDYMEPSTSRNIPPSMTESIHRTLKTDTECGKLELDSDDDSTLSNEYEPIDGVKLECVKVKSNDDRDSTLPNEKLPWKKKKSRKRKARPFEDDYDNAEQKKHHCSAYTLIKSKCAEQPVKPEMKAEVSGSCQKLPLEDPEESPYMLQMNIIYDNIIDGIQRNEILKSTLPSLGLQSEPELVDDSTPKSYQWEILVDNPIISKVDGRIKQTAESFLYKPHFYTNVLKTITCDLKKLNVFNGWMKRWNLYGSYLNRSVCKDSAIQIHLDCSLAISKKKKKNSQSENPVPQVPQDLFVALRTALEAAHDFDCLEYRTSVYFPWIKVFHPGTKKEIEITISTVMNSGELRVHNSLLTKLYLDLNPDLKHLMVFLKLILQKYNVHGIHGSGKLTSYALFWFIVFFMQQKKLLPTVIDVRKLAKIKHYIAEWDCSLPENYSYQVEPAPVSLYALLLEFFEYYSDFDFIKYLISPYLGQVILMSDFQRLQIPRNEFSVYLRQIENSRKLSFKKNVINLQDPTDLGFNVTGCLKLASANQFKAVCHYLSDFLPSSLEEIEKMDCFCALLPFQMEYSSYFPYNLTQYYSFELNTTANLGLDREKKLNQIHILEAVRKIMELFLKFEKRSVVIAPNVVEIVFNENNEEFVKRTFPVIYFEYYSTENTWQTYLKDIVTRNENERNKVRVILTCEVCLEKRVIRFLVQSNADFVKFLRFYLPRLLRDTLLRIVPSQLS